MRLLNQLILISFAMLNVGILLAGVSLDDAAKQIGRNKQWQVLSAKTVRDEGKEVHVFRVLTQDGRVQHIKVDAETGRLVGHSGKH